MFRYMVRGIIKCLNFVYVLYMLCNKAGNRFVGILQGGKGVWMSDKRLVLSRNQNTSIQFVYKFAPYINDKETDKSCCFNTLANTFLLSTCIQNISQFYAL